MTRLSSPVRRVGGWAFAGVLTVGLLGACAEDGSDDPTSGASSDPPGTATETATDPYLPAPDGVELTAPGTSVDLGESAVLAWEPRQDEVGVVEVSVDRLEQTTFEESFDGWQVDRETAKRTPYFAHVSVENVGDTDLGRDALPLYATAGGDVLVEPTGFQGSFEPCPGGALPKKFRPGDEAELCLVFLTERAAELEGVAFLPAAGLDPVTWAGRITTPKDGPKGGKEKGGDGGGGADGASSAPPPTSPAAG